ncbi:MAG: hypothetical protein SGPRY_005925 [Prymnesium sp.]
MARLAVAVALLCVGASGQGMSMSAEEEEMLEQMGIQGQPMGRKNLKPQAEIIKSDLKYIYCNVCRKMVEIAYEKSAQLLEQRFTYKTKRKNELTEFDGEGAIQDYIEKMWYASSNPLKSEGEWVSKIDLVQEGDQLQLGMQPTYGHCEQECRTIEQACNDVIDKADTEFSEIRASPNSNCLLLEDYKFRQMTAEEKQMVDMQANLKETGMSGTMYRREDLAGMMDKLGDMGLGGMGEGMEDDGMPDDSGDDVDESAEEEKEEL